MWFDLMTLTTVGYGDKAPITRTGWGITGAWIVISLIAVSYLTASLSSAFTLFLSGTTEAAIDSPEQLIGRRVAVVEGTDGMELAGNREMRVVPSPSLDSAAESVLDRKADALIFDRHSLRYHLKQNPDIAVRIAPFTLADETYGFVLTPNSELRTRLGVSILKLQQSGGAEAIADKFLD